jgi:hypothetical protein
MYFKWDDYRHADGEVDVTMIQQQRMFSPRNRYVFIRKTLTVQGHLCVSGQDAIRSAINLLEDGYRYEWNTVGLYHDDGTPSAHVLDFNSSLNGIRLLTLDYPKEDGGEYATGRSFRAVFQADYLMHEMEIYSWEETIQVIGTGGPDWELVPQFIGPPLKQINCMQTPQIIIQSGEAVGITGYIQPPAPYWPNDEHGNRRSIIRGTCQKKGRLPGGSLLWPTQWSYRFSLPYSISNEGIAPPNV